MLYKQGINSIPQERNIVCVEGVSKIHRHLIGKGSNTQRNF